MKATLRMAVIKKVGDNKWQQGCGQAEPLSTAGASAPENSLGVSSKVK